MGRLLNVLLFTDGGSRTKEAENVVPHTHLGIQVLMWKGCRPYGAWRFISLWALPTFTSLTACLNQQRTGAFVSYTGNASQDISFWGVPGFPQGYIVGWTSTRACVKLIVCTQKWDMGKLVWFCLHAHYAWRQWLNLKLGQIFANLTQFHNCVLLCQKMQK